MKHNNFDQVCSWTEKHTYHCCDGKVLEITEKGGRANRCESKFVHTYLLALKICEIAENLIQNALLKHTWSNTCDEIHGCDGNWEQWRLKKSVSGRGDPNQWQWTYCNWQAWLTPWCEKLPYATLITYCPPFLQAVQYELRPTILVVSTRW